MNRMDPVNQPASIGPQYPLPPDVPFAQWSDTQHICPVCGLKVGAEHVISVNEATREVSCPDGTVSHEWFNQHRPGFLVDEPGEGRPTSVALEDQEEQEDAVFATLVEASTLPNLGALFQAGIKAGVIKPTIHYHN